MKKFLAVALTFVFVGAFLFSGTQEFSKGDKFLTGQVGLNSYAIPFGASYGMAINENVEVGGTVMLYFWSDPGFSYTVISPSLDAMYHFTKLEAENVDLFAGASLGYSIFSVSSDYGTYTGTFSSSLYLSPFVGGRYYFNEKTAVSLRLHFAVSGTVTGVGGLLGVTFKM